MSRSFRKRGVDYPLSERMLALPGRYFHDQAIYEEELDKIFYQRWLFACRAEEIAGPGDFVVREIGHESIILVRDHEDVIRAWFNVCRHRGTRICTDASGCFTSKHIQCPYHAWTYNLQGELVSAPQFSRAERGSDRNFALFPAATHVWEGFVFINLSRDPVPFAEQMGQLNSRFADWDLPALRCAHRIRYDLKCNWKLIFQNYQECYHCPGVHPLLSTLTPFDSAAHDCMEGAVIGGYMDLTRQRGSMTMDGKAAGPPLGRVSGDDLQRVYYYTVYPNLLLTPHPDFVLYHHIIPHGPGRITNICHWLFHPDVINDVEAADRIQSAVAFWDLTNRQDWAVCEQMQAGTRSTRYDRGLYMSSEDVLYALDREYLRMMGHDMDPG
ncbi:MAG: aromatic ring-hydroxylating dioxygenase subunit alpha [Saprospiraceae bacterium]|nr:aromatic ring-hydroxylating dioxygenase subunit alpha [Saprospiraceae bacterium]